jgi:PPOX class probable F420-dependent enzyme
MLGHDARVRSMNRDEARAFLLASPRTAKAATVRSDGRPHVTPVWFDVDGEQILFTTWHASTKGRNLLRDPRISLCVEDDRPPFAYVMLEGTVVLSEDVAEVRAWATRIAARYMGRMRARTFGERNGIPGELLVRVTPTRILGEAGVAD